MIVHAANDVDFVVVCWWGAQNELLLRVLTAPAAQPRRLCQHSNMDGPMVAVWGAGLFARSAGRGPGTVDARRPPRCRRLSKRPYDGEI